MSYRALSEALLTGRPYVGLALRAMQGPPERHRYFRPIVKAAAERLSCPLAILEIGSWAGASAISWGTALRDLELEGTITCVDPWLPYFDTSVDTMPVYREMNRAAEDKLIYKLFLHNVATAGLQNVIRTKQGSSRIVLPQLSAQGYGIVYIDGSHSYENVVFDIRQAKRLLRDGGIICGDDLELESGQIDPTELAHAVQGGQDFVLSGSVGRYYHPGVTAAVAEVIGTVSVWDGFWAIRIHEGHWEQVSLDLESATLPPHITLFLQRIEGQTGHYDLYSQDGRYFAVWRGIPSDLIDELLIENDLPPLIFVGGTLQEVAEKAERAKQVTPEATQPPRIVDQHRGFNIVRFKDLVYGLRQSVGEVDLSLDEKTLVSRYGNLDLIVGTTVDGIKTRIDGIELCRIVQRLEQEINQQPAWLGELRSSLELQAFESRQHAVDEAVRAASECITQATINVRAEFLRELEKIADALGRERNEKESFMRAVQEETSESQRQAIKAREATERLQLKVDEVGNALSRIAALVDELRSGPGDYQTPRVVGHYRGFRLVLKQGKIHCVPDGADDANVIFESSSPEPDVARARIDVYLTEQAVASLETRIANFGVRGMWRKLFSTESERKVRGG